MGEYRGVGELAIPPLVYTAAFVFIDIAEIEKYSAKLQDILRDEYPGFSTMQISVQEHRPEGLRPIDIPHFIYNDPNLEWGVIIRNNRFVFHTTAYKNFQGFCAKFQNVFEKFLEVTKLKHYSGIAYRQIDHFTALEGIEEKKLSDTVYEKFLSSITHAIPQSVPMFSRHESIYKIEDKVRATVRNYVFNEETSGPFVPDDLIPFYLALDPTIASNPHNFRVNPPAVMADFEAIKNLRPRNEEIALGGMINDLDKLHQYVSLLFREVILPEALERRR